MGALALAVCALVSATPAVAQLAPPPPGAVCDTPRWVVEQRVLYLTGAASGVGTLAHAGGLGRVGRTLDASENQRLLDANTAASSYYICRLRLGMATNQAGPGGAPAIFWFDFGNEDGGGRSTFALRPGQPGFSAVALNARAWPVVDEEPEHTVAHESCHAVQAEILGERYKPHWVLEGQADGIALWALETMGRADHRARLRRLARSSVDKRRFIRIAGARFYDRTLAIDMDPGRYPNSPAELRHSIYQDPATAYWFVDGGASRPQPVFRRGLAWRHGYQTQSFWHWLARQPNGDQAINSIMLTSVPGNAEADWVT